jgi:hypothetical protein
MEIALNIWNQNFIGASEEKHEHLRTCHLESNVCMHVAVWGCIENELFNSPQRKKYKTGLRSENTI